MEVKTDDLKIGNAAKLLNKTTDVAFMYYLLSVGAEAPHECASTTSGLQRADDV
jgi:hypothetical protein